MKRLDKMDSAVGRDDIDYILASPFLGDSVEHKQGHRQREFPAMHSLPLSAGAPRNPDGTVKSAYVPPPYAGSGTYAPGESHRTSGPVVRPLATSPATAESSTVGSSVSVAGSRANNVEYFEAGIDDDSNQKKSRRVFSEAKSAIRRYTRFMSRDVSFSSQQHANIDDHIHTASSGSTNIQGHIEDHTNEVCDKAFVVMKTFTASTIAIQSMHSSRPGSMQVTTAPEPRDILWGNVYLSKGAKRTRSYIGEALILIITTFYIVPVALVSLLVSESALISSSPR